jgi:ubiquinone/menaquinone biosynthesis C-methylase UbiE
MLDPDIRAYYDLAQERDRLGNELESLELVRSRELLDRFLPRPPARVLDVGGGTGTYAAWLASAGFQVHVVDPVPLHVEQTEKAAADQPEHAFTTALGDARNLYEPDASYDAVLLMGPLYHLTERYDRQQALSEAKRVVRPSGLVLAVAISRFASLLDGLRMGALIDADFSRIVERDLQEGQHRNPHIHAHPDWFTTAYFHRPEELAEEIAESGLQLEAILGIEGPGWLMEHRWRDPLQRDSVLRAARIAEAEPALLGASAHIMAVARNAS